MRKTKIVCTLGPACNSKSTIKQMAERGMNVARLNFSHGTHEYHRSLIDTVKSIRNELGSPLAILLDTKGPEIRTGCFDGGKAVLCTGDEVKLTTVQQSSDNKIISVTYTDLPLQLTAGNFVLIDDGKVRLEVISTTQTDINCKVISGGIITDRKGINIPGVSLDMPYLNDTDKNDIIFGIENDVDFIAASFVRRKEDVIELRKFIDYHGGHSIRIIAKIENIEGVENFDSILQHSDGIMVARGDMGVEVDYEKLPGLQKKFIRKCYQSGKMVITATQMLDSMIYSPTPTRAEITDVANAVFDGTSAVMLSGETAAGKYPLEAISAMAKIAEQAEQDAFDMDIYREVQYVNDQEDTTNAICDAACTMARDVQATAIIAVTKSGYTARRVSKFRPSQPIIATTPVEKTYHQLALSWGVYPIKSLFQPDANVLFTHSVDCAKRYNYINAGDRVVITAGTDFTTDVLKLQTVTEERK